jgi:hypothetical protein
MRVAWSIDVRPMSTHADVVSHLPDDCFDKVTRSTIPLLDYWREPVDRLQSLGALLGWPAFTAAELLFERQVPVVQGKGKASFTDLMIVGEQSAIAIEAKYTEPPYQSVADWLEQGDAANRARVLGGWLSRIGQVAGTVFGTAAVEALPYQLIHRTASACSMPASRRAVVYQVFNDTHLGYYNDSLRSLAALLGEPATLALAVLHVPATLKPRSEGALAGATLREQLQAASVYVFGDASWSPASR